MDSTDRQLLSLLRDNARLSVAALAKTLGVARGTVQNRLARMEKDGTIVGYTVKLKPQDEDQRIRALMTVAVEGNRTDEVLRALRGDPAVCALHTTNGRWDIVAELRTDSSRSGGQGVEPHPSDRRNLQHGNQPATLHSQVLTSPGTPRSTRRNSPTRVC